MNAQTALIAQQSGLALAGPIGSFDAYLDRKESAFVLDYDEEAKESYIAPLAVLYCPVCGTPVPD